MHSFERILIMKKSRWIDFGVVCGLFFLAFMFAVLRHDSQIKTMDQAGFALTMPITAMKTRVMLLITAFGSPQFLGPVTLIMMLILWWKKCLGDSMWYGAMQFVGYLLVIAFKSSVMRPRPAHQLEKIGGYSFPSGHTFATAIFVLTLLALVWPRLKSRWVKILLGIIGAGWIFLVMYSRVYLHVHYASDVWAGLLLALCWWLIANSQKERFMNWLAEIQK